MGAIVCGSSHSSDSRTSRAACVAFLAGLAIWLAGLRSGAQTVTIDCGPSSRHQLIDGFGTCLSGNEGQQSWWRSLYFNDLQSSMLRVDLTPAFKSPYSDFTYNSPWFHNNPQLPGPETNNVRTYTSATNYSRLFAGRSAPIAVMGPDINFNTNYFDFAAGMPGVAGPLAQLGDSRRGQLGDFKLFGSHWSPAPWVKVLSGNLISGQSGYYPSNSTPWPFIWGGNFSGGKLDTSGTPLNVFDDSSVGGTGPTSALTQFVRCTAAYLRGFQNTYRVHFYSISIQNELNFEEFYNSCTYPLSSGYITALKAVRAELDKYPDLAGIKLMGPEDLLGGDAYGMWQFGGGSGTIHKNLQYLQNIAADPIAAAAESFFCIHGYASDGVSAANATPTSWLWWANGWTSSPAAGVPPNVQGFIAYGKKSWMTETSGENPAWLSPPTGYPSGGAWSLALRIQQALVFGQQSAWAYWQLTDGNSVGAQTLTDSGRLTNSAKYVAAKHFFRYIRPNSIRVDGNIAGSTNLVASAFLHETNRSLTAILINSTPNALQATITLTNLPFSLATFRTYTSSDTNYWRSGSTQITNSTASVNVPGYGVVTLYGVAQPRLGAVSLGNSQLALTWPQAGVGFMLQSTSNLSPTTIWTPLTNSGSITNDIASVMLPAAQSAQYYRLFLP
jgi:O-glycosyl hydrolase